MALSARGRVKSHQVSAKKRLAGHPTREDVLEILQEVHQITDTQTLEGFQSLIEPSWHPDPPEYFLKAWGYTEYPPPREIEAHELMLDHGLRKEHITSAVVHSLARSIQEAENQRIRDWLEEYFNPPAGTTGLPFVVHQNHPEFDPMLNQVLARRLMAYQGPNRMRGDYLLLLEGQWGSRAKPVTSPQSTDSNPGSAPSQPSQRTNLFGYPITACLRWMGKEGWTKAQARKCLDEMDIPIADGTIHAQLSAGRQGLRGDPAKLTEAQERDLYSCLEE